MERLTHKAKYEAGYKANRDVPVWACIDRLGKYEDLEERGEMIILPCAAGDTVYVKMENGGFAEGEVRDYSHFLSCGFCIVVTSKYFNKQHIPFSEFGKTVFLTREQAEEALKRKTEEKCDG